MTAPDERGGFTPPPAFSIEPAPAPPGALVLVLAGEVDLATSGQFRRHVQQAYEGPATTVVLDLTDVTFVDSTMLRELLRAHGDLRERERRLVLAGVRPAVQRLLQLTGTLDVFEVHADRDEALRTLG